MLQAVLLALVCGLSHSFDVSLFKISAILTQGQFFGSWNSSLEHPFNDFEGQAGEVYLQFHTNATSSYMQEESDNVTIQQAILIFLDPKYFEENVVQGSLQLAQYNQSTQTWSGNSTFDFSTFYKQRQIDRKFGGVCKVNYTLKVELINPQDNLTIQNSRVQLNMTQALDDKNNTDCGILIDSNMTKDNTNSSISIWIYCLLADCMCALQFYCVSRLCKNLLTIDFENVSRLSIYTVGFVTIYDTYLSLQNLYYALNMYRYFQYFIVPSMLYLLLSTTCDLKLLWILWRSRYEYEFQDPNLQRKYFARFFIIFYSSVIVLFILMRCFELYNWFLILIAFFITPQIIHNIKQGNNPRFIPEYIVGVILVNMALPLYFRANPNNFRGLKPSALFCCFWVGLFLGQTLILYLQHKYGPRFIIPKFLQPKQYNYYQEYKPRDMEECAICLNSLMMEPEQLEQDLDKVLLIKTLMITPCNHKFHPTCLKNWMDVKLQCPTCRQTIPPWSD